MSERRLINRAAVERVRFATRDDAPEVMALCREMYAENGQLPMSERKVKEVLEEAFAQRGGIVGVIGGPGQKIEGCICLRIGQLWYSEAWMLSEYFSFVRPEFRRSTNALDLVEFAKDCAQRMKLKLFIAVVSSTRTEAKIRLFERRLDKAKGAFFIYDGDDGTSGPADLVASVAGG